MMKTCDIRGRQNKSAIAKPQTVLQSLKPLIHKTEAAHTGSIAETNSNRFNIFLHILHKTKTSFHVQIQFVQLGRIKETELENG